jgi:hypothetical protein
MEQRRAEGQRELAPEYLLEEGEFRALVAHERACSDRSGSPFSVLAFELSREAAVRAPLVGAIVARVRATDALGWLEDGRLGVLLRYASVDDALAVAHQVRARAGAAPGELACTVHGYPPFARGAVPDSDLVPPPARGPSHALGQHDPP